MRNIKKKITLLQYRLLHYRKPLFECMRALAKERGLDLNLCYGQASNTEKHRKDEVSLEWAYKVRNIYWRVGGRDLQWQPIPRELRDSDFFIVMQENKILSNYPLILHSFFDRPKVAFWGHGKNFQSNSPNGYRERWKKKINTCVGWWFAYTKLSANIVEKLGFDHNRITCLDNAIDTKSFKSELDSIGFEEVKEVRSRFDMPEDSLVGLYCGSLYPDKKLDFLIEAGVWIRAEISDFHLFIIGDGPSADLFKKAMSRYCWLHWLGMKTGREKAIFFRMAHIILNPGAFGLHILDAFCSGIPFVAVADAKHGPESCYLKEGENGFLTRDDPKEYAKVVLNVLLDRELYGKICENAYLDGCNYSIEKMAVNFVDGIEKALVYETRHLN